MFHATGEPLAASTADAAPSVGVLPWLIATSLTLIGASGCSPVSREELAKEVLKVDPSFASVLEKHHELTNRITTYERELALKRATIEQNIAQLRKDLAAAVANVRVKIEDVKKRMEPDQRRLQHELAMAGEELRAKRDQRASLGRQVAELRKGLKNAASSWSAKERARQEAQVNEMLRDAKRLDHEMDGLKEHIRLLKIKLLLIRL